MKEAQEVNRWKIYLSLSWWAIDEKILARKGKFFDSFESRIGDVTFNLMVRFNFDNRGNRADHRVHVLYPWIGTCSIFCPGKLIKVLSRMPTLSCSHSRTTTEQSSPATFQANCSENWLETGSLKRLITSYTTFMSIM